MCGINGIVSLRATPPPTPERERLIDLMNDAIAHRGPDGAGVFVQDAVAFGHRRLSILDLSEFGTQPMFNEDGTVVVVFNGEIYNYLELVPELVARGHRFRSRSDTEVILHAYEEYGSDCVKRFNGMWAFALYDFRNAVFFASRDRLGVKPFYFLRNREHLVFSSEIKAILKVAGAARANPGKVYDYLAYGYKTSNGETFFADVEELPPATNLLIRNGHWKQWRYWELPTSEAHLRRCPDLPRLCETFMELLQDAVRLRFRSDVPVAILLSGGLDSTAITRTVDDLISGGRLDCHSVQAFSAAFPGYRNDESELAREFIATCRNVRLQPVYPRGAHLPDDMVRIAYGLGEPVFSATTFAHYSLMREIHRTGFKVVINGQGADEAFCGYDRYFLGYFLLDTLLSRPFDILPQARAMHDRLGYTYTYVLAQILKAMLPRRAASYVRGKWVEGIVGCLDPAFVRTNYGYLRNARSTFSSACNLDRYLRDNLQYYSFGQILHYEDHSSMQHSVEIRSPFVDYRMIEFAFSLPIRAKYDMGVTKRIVREAFAERLPASILHNRRKIGFATPFASWLAEPLFRSFVQDVLDSASFAARSIWSASKLRRVFAHPDAHPAFPFWRVLNLELWARAYGVTGL
jgi:asparagine synthase (glutamine-hydrolysing)